MKLNSIRIGSALDIVGQSGVFASQPFKKDSIILSLTGELKDQPTRTSIKIGDNKHVEDSVGIFINHNCNPSCRVEKHRVVAEKDIAVGEEITFDYSKNEDDLFNPFVCSCCNKLIS